MDTTDVRETARNAVNQGKSLLGQQVDDRTTQLGQQVGSFAQDLRSVGDQLRENGAAGLAAGYVDRGVEIVERLGRYLEDADSERLIGDLENYARQRPWAVAAGALVLGFAASRFLKTSSARRYRTGSDSGYGDASGSYGMRGSYGTGSAYGDSTSYDAGARYAT